MEQWKDSKKLASNLVFLIVLLLIVLTGYVQYIEDSRDMQPATPEQLQSIIH
uniref:Uncharacterized protein n=1 Tax=Klebsiella pneumoniae TaxID=573 RepID=A0A8B0SUU3_KLEPN|nr:hypothetical protein [Klebsiella pneumoniae]